MYEIIPPAIRELLSKRWQPTQVGYSFFESVWGDSDDRGRRAQPSWYIYSKEPGGEGGNMLTTPEVRALANVPEFKAMVLERAGNYAVNEHLEHALSDFMSKVYDAWDEFSERARQIEARQSPPDPDHGQ